MDCPATGGPRLWSGRRRARPRVDDLGDLVAARLVDPEEDDLESRLESGWSVTGRVTHSPAGIWWLLVGDEPAVH